MCIGVFGLPVSFVLCIMCWVFGVHGVQCVSLFVVPCLRFALVCWLDLCVCFACCIFLVFGLVLSFVLQAMRTTATATFGATRGVLSARTF